MHDSRSGDCFDVRRFISVACGILLSCLPSSADSADGDAERDRSTPNILMVIADDQSWTDFGFMGNARVSTPRLDKLAKQSALFRHGYVPSSVCRPSLATMLTGLYPFQHGVYFNHGPPGNAGYNRMSSREDYETHRKKEFGLIAKCQTLPTILRQRGYRCLQTGKFWEGHWRNGGFTEGMTTFEPPPKGQAFGGVRRLANGERVAHGNGDAGLQIGRSTLRPIYDFVDDCGQQNTPWFVWYAPYLPHQPHDSPPEFYEQARTAGALKHELPYFASIAQFDHSVGELVDALREREQLRNTVIVFVSDNGWKPSQELQKGREKEFSPTKRSKRAPFDDGLRTPVFFWWDGVITPHAHDTPVSSVDLVPTLLSLTTKDAGEKHPVVFSEINPDPKRAMLGVDLWPIIQGKKDPSANRSIFGEIYPGDATTLGDPDADIAYRWIRQGKWKLIVPHAKGARTPWGGYLDEISLFDLMLDPHEQSDLAPLPEHASLIKDLLRLLDQHRPVSDAARN